ncbi:MAG: copper resistance protein CopC/CopD, partial [Acidimicrobiia bacterium]|nr:copper resistance protein CopC/CopD [Acidimicrobiia bacterium]
MGIFRRTAAVAASMAAIMLLLVESPAAAHAGVESSDPTAGAVLDDPVSEITLVFTDRTEPIGDGFQVIEADGEIRTPNDWESSDGRTFRLHFDPPITGGETGMQWTIRSADFHALNGGFVFTVVAEEPDVTVPEADAERSPAVVSAVEPLTGETTSADPGNDRRDEFEEAAALAVVTERPTIESVPVVADPIPGVPDAELNGSAGMRALGIVGRLATMAGSLVAIGALVFLIRVLCGTVGEGRLVMAIARRAALVIVAGVIAESVAQVVVRGGGWASILSPVEWTEALSSRFGGAVALHLIGAFGVSTGSHFHREQIGSRRSDVIRADMTRVGVLAAGPPSSAVTNHPPLENGAEVGASLTPLLFRWRPTSVSYGAVMGIVALLAAALVDGHTMGGPDLLLSAAVTLTHVLAGSVWVGGVIVLFLLLRRRIAVQRRVEAVDVAVRYSVLASLSLVGVALAGLILTYTHLDSISQLWTTEWGRLVMAKLSLVAIAASLGAVNHFV